MVGHLVPYERRPANRVGLSSLSLDGAFLAAAFALLSALGPCAQAQADECATDADCGEREKCRRSPCGECEGALECVEVRPEECVRTNDCPAGLTCVVSESQTRWGLCSIPETACRTIDDCPLGLSCTGELQGADGTPLCSYNPAQCVRDADCPADFRCEFFYESHRCTNGELSSNCSSPINECVPPQLSCNTTSDCPASWQCVELEDCSDVEGCRAGGYRISASWKASTGDLRCLPPGAMLQALTNLTMPPRIYPSKPASSCSASPESDNQPMWGILAISALLFTWACRAGREGTRRERQHIVKVR